jgi:hypothetical protein
LDRRDHLQYQTARYSKNVQLIQQTEGFVRRFDFALLVIAASILGLNPTSTATRVNASPCAFLIRSISSCDLARRN